MKYRHRVLGMLSLLAVITYLDRVCIGVAGPRMQDALHISPQAWGWVTSVFFLSYSAFEIPTGVLGDRIGPRRVSGLWRHSVSAAKPLHPLPRRRPQKRRCRLWIHEHGGQCSFGLFGCGFWLPCGLFRELQHAVRPDDSFAVRGRAALVKSGRYPGTLPRSASPRTGSGQLGLGLRWIFGKAT